MSNGTYALPAFRFDIAVPSPLPRRPVPTGVPVDPRPPRCVERVVDLAAVELGIDPPRSVAGTSCGDDVFPFTTLTGAPTTTPATTRSPSTPRSSVGTTTLLAEQAARATGDRLQLGIGVASYVEVTAGGGGSEYAAVEINDDGTVTMKAGTSAHGQGHVTSLRDDRLRRTGIPIDQIRLIQSDTDSFPRAAGTGGARSLQLAGSAVHEATEACRQGRSLAAHLLEAGVSTTSSSTPRQAPSASPASRPGARVGRVGRSGRRVSPTGSSTSQMDRSAWPPSSTSTARRHVPLRHPRLGRRGRHRDRRRRRCCATSRSTTAGPLNPCWSPASSMAASPRARPRPCTRGRQLRR